MNARPSSLEEVHAACWRELVAAAQQRTHGWRLPALATLASAADGGTPQADARHVVLREVDAAARLLVFYTDSRSHKVAQLRAQPQATLLAWCPRLGWQLRLRARLAVDTGGLAVSSRWATLKMHPAAQDYLSPLAPGTPLDQASPPGPPSPDRASRAHFAVVFASIERIDWLELHAEGHRRAAFDAAGQGQWLTP